MADATTNAQAWRMKAISCVGKPSARQNCNYGEICRFKLYNCAQEIMKYADGDSFGERVPWMQSATPLSCLSTT